MASMRWGLSKNGGRNVNNLDVRTNRIRHRAQPAASRQTANRQTANRQTANRQTANRSG
jgi:hypothetical protein